MSKLLAILFVIGPNLSFAQILIERDLNGNIKKEYYFNNYSITYQYDSSGNRIMTVISESACPGDNSTFYAGSNASTANYQWQSDTGTGYLNIVDDTIYSGTQTPYLKLTNPPTSWYGNKYRCVISGVNGIENSEEQTLKFQLVWSGTISSEWENPANWSCNKVPDGYTDVIVNGGTLFNPIVNSNAFVRSIAFGPNADWTVNAPYIFTITNY
jgi:hypothetical protein